LEILLFKGQTKDRANNGQGGNRLCKHQYENSRIAKLENKNLVHDEDNLFRLSVVAHFFSQENDHRFYKKVDNCNSH
jgi:hypothetical protein